MCGIVGYVGFQEALPIIISGLEKLEYRGYDSAGVAVYGNGKVSVTRAIGKLGELKKLLNERSAEAGGSLGIGHTRWATHGKPSENNAHPHTAGRVSLIHNGIVENYVELREELEKEGSQFKSETDTEIAAHLVNKYLNKGLDPFDALKAACADIRGSYAFLAIDSQNPDRILVAKNSTPIIIGIGKNEMFVASDIPAVLPYTREVVILEDGDMADVRCDGVRIENNGKPVQRKVQTITWDPITAQKGGYKHYMLKEIHEQAQAVTDTFRGRVEQEEGAISLPELAFDDKELAGIQRIVFVACGTAWHACLVAKFYIESFTQIPCEVDYASEFRYRQAVFDKNTLVIAVSQSGETADTLAAIELAGTRSPTMAVCNVLGSSIARKVGNVLFTHAGPEISVASTKAFTTQLVAVYLLAIYLAQRRGTLAPEKVGELTHSLLHLPAAIQQAVEVNSAVEKVAQRFRGAKDFLYLGRGICYPIALEGALKLKEISYVHAEGYPAGEMKHGPIALIDENMPVVVLLQRSKELFEKTISNLREVEARGGKIIAVTDFEGSKELHALTQNVIEVPFVSDFLSPLIMTIPLQLLAYHIAVFNGTDVDLPRNLAKSVTVE
ncbi:MAG: glutamine--fructose-6-phosphate transaminase (isomerizing) [Deltaproteobacteria bacterium]|nr:glutamine--fructose-6-phosphate transaminase (isomerizing) [Deltaproteobacteria bacterium]